MEKPCRVFCCYARRDQEFLLDLKTHLKSLEREGLITVKADIDISPGTEWEPTINHHLGIADIILLLISPDFIASDYCFDKEMQEAVTRHEQGTARVVPVIIRPASWHRMPFGKLQALPKDATPVSISQDRDTALLSVTKGIRLVVQELTANTPVVKWEARDDAFRSVPEGIPTVPQRLNMPVNQKEEFKKALTSAFDKIADLQELMYYKFDINLNEIARTNNLSECILDLIRWGESRGKTEKLICAVLEERSENVQVVRLASKMGITLDSDSEASWSQPSPADSRSPQPSEGLLSLKRAEQALWDGGYGFARNELRKAIGEIDRENQLGAVSDGAERENQLRAASKARYLLILALLDGKLPRLQGKVGMQSIEELMETAIKIHPYASYYRIFARIKKDYFEYNGLRHRLNEVQILEGKGALYPRSRDDEENEEYFRHCQPRLPI